MFKSFRAFRSLMANDLLQERIQHSGILGPTRPANYRDVMLHRKLVSEEVTVLDLWINHTGDSEGGVDGSLTLLSCTQGTPDFWRIHQRVEKERRGARRAGSLQRCAVGMAGLLCWRVIKKGALTERGRAEEIEKRHCSTALIPNFGLITAALYKSFEISLFKRFAESCQCLLRTNLWLPLQKAQIGEERDTKTMGELTVRRLGWPYVIVADGLCSFYLVSLFRALLCNIHVSLSQSYIGHFTSTKSKSHMIICYQLVGEPPAGSADCAERCKSLASLFS